jgi:hypothetical protein
MMCILHSYHAAAQYVALIMMCILHSYHAAAQYVALIMMCILTSHHTAPCVAQSSLSLVSSKCSIELKGHHRAHLQHHTFLISSSSPSAFCIPVACLFVCFFAFFGVGSLICLLSLAFVHLLVFLASSLSIDVYYLQYLTPSWLC